MKGENDMFFVDFAEADLVAMYDRKRSKFSSSQKMTDVFKIERARRAKKNPKLINYSQMVLYEKPEGESAEDIRYPSPDISQSEKSAKTSDKGFVALRNKVQTDDGTYWGKRFHGRMDEEEEEKEEGEERSK